MTSHILTKRRNDMFRSPTGSALIGIIVVMLIFSALGAALLPMVSTSSFSYAGSQASERAYYLAESGYRYLMGRYRNENTTAAKDAVLDEINDQKTYNLSGGQGEFDLVLYPFFFLASSSSSGTTLTVNIPGTLGEEWDSFPSSGWLKIGQEVHAFSGHQDLSDASSIDFSMANALNSIEDNTAVLLVAKTSGNQVIDDENKDLNLSGNTGDGFPGRNGQVLINGNLFFYKENDRNNNQLMGLESLEDGAATISVPDNSDIILAKHIIIASTGRYMETGSNTERTVTYHATLPSNGKWDMETQEETTESFNEESLSGDWVTVWGGDDAHAAKAIRENNALAVENTNWNKGHGYASLIRYDWLSKEVNLNNARKSLDGYLSYDTQIKVGFELTSTPPNNGYQPEGTPIPKYYSAGLSFRLDGSQNMYGLSMLRGNNAFADRFDLNIEPETDTHLLVLWQATNSGQDKKWLAYKYLDHKVYYDDVETPGTGWTQDPVNSWVRDECNYSIDYCDGRDWLWTDSPDSTRYEDGIIKHLISPEIDISGLCDATLEFSHRYRIVQTNNVYCDKGFVHVSRDGGEWQQVEAYTGDFAEGGTTQIPITDQLGPERIELRFTLDTKDDPEEDEEDDVSYGWLIDDIAILQQLPAAKPTIENDPSTVDSTLLVRVKEAQIVAFSSSNPDVMKDGEWIVAGDDITNAGQIYGAPLLTHKNAESGVFEGLLQLINVTGNFNPNDTLYIRNQEVGTVTGTMRRSNLITVFYGKTACDQGDTNPLNFNSHANPRETDANDIELHWPPEDLNQWEEADDYLTLIQWDEVNESDATHEAFPLLLEINGAEATTTEKSVVVQSWEPALLTSGDGENFTRPELGLHALGDGAENVYFDDFGLYFAVGHRLGPSIQE